jgi:F-type H+-transporting ATPase subunit b
LENARNDHKAVVQERMDHIGKLADTVEVTEALYAMSKVQMIEFRKLLNLKPNLMN